MLDTAVEPGIVGSRSASGTQGDRRRVALALWFAAFDTPAHVTVLGHALAETKSHVDSGVATIG